MNVEEAVSPVGEVEQMPIGQMGLAAAGNLGEVVRGIQNQKGMANLGEPFVQ